MKNFTISLYAFHLRHTLTDLPNEADPNANILWENLAKLGKRLLPFPELKNLRSKLICYQNGKYEPKLELGRQTDWLSNSGGLDLGSVPTAEGFKIQGNLQPFLVNDTYAADLTLSPESSNISIDVPQLQLFKPDCLLPSTIQASLGQTLWIYGEVDASENCQALASKCAVALLAGTNLNPVQINEDQLFGSLLFEYQATDPNEPQNSAKQTHILVSLNNSNADTLTLAGKAYDWLLNLLICYHKTLYIYQEARNHYPKARELYSKLDKQMQDFPNLIADPETRLVKLKELLTKSPLDSVKYNRCLGDLKAHHTAITTNTTNYRTCLEKIKAIGYHPHFWEDFLNCSSNQWQNQIQIYIDYLAPGQELFEKMIDTIRGLVETEQAESDRSLQNKVAIMGVGLAAAAVGATVAPYMVSPEPQKPILPPWSAQSTNHFHPLTQALLLSFVFGATGAVATKGFITITGRLTKLIRGSSNKTAKLPERTQQTLPQSQKPKK